MGTTGFQSPADDFIHDTIDLNKLCIKNPPATFFVRMQGDSMKGIAIGDGDLLIIDKSKKPVHECIAVCFYDGEWILRQLIFENKKLSYLKAYHPKCKDIYFEEGDELSVFGVVVHVIKTF